MFHDYKPHITETYFHMCWWGLNQLVVIIIMHYEHLQGCSTNEKRALVRKFNKMMELPICFHPISYHIASLKVVCHLLCVYLVGHDRLSLNIVV